MLLNKRRGLIPTLWCWLVGHKKWTDIYTGKTATVTSRLTGGPHTIPVVRSKQNAICSRCGDKIDWS